MDLREATAEIGRSLKVHSVTTKIWRHACLGLAMLAGSVGQICAEPADYRLEKWSVARSPNMNHQWDIATGLPQISVRALSSDHDDLLWVGTENGLARFDGQNFEIFNSDNTEALTANWIDALFTDKSGTVWIGTVDGVAYRQNQTFKRLPSNKPIRAKSFTQTDNGIIWIASSRLWQVQNGIAVRAPFVDFSVDAIAATGETLWITDVNGQLYAYHNGALTTINAPELASGAITSIAAVEERLAVAIADKVITVTMQGNAPAITKLASLPFSVVAISGFRQGGVLAITADGAANTHGLTDQDGWETLNLPAKVPLDHGTLALITADENIWIGTNTGGLQTFWPSAVKREGYETPFAEARVWSFFVGDGVYAASDEGIFKRSDGLLWDQIVSPEEYANARAYSFLLTDSSAWIGTRSGLYVRPNTGTAFDTNQKQTFKKVAQTGERQINSMIEEQGRVWFGLAPVEGSSAISRALSLWRIQH